MGASSQRKPTSNRSTRRTSIAACSRPLLPSLPARALERVVHGRERDLQPLGERRRALPALDLLPELTGLVIGELEGTPALARHAVAGTGGASGPASTSAATSTPACALERVVHGRERDLQLLGERSRALPALDLPSEADCLFLGELERASTLPRGSVSNPCRAPRLSVEEVPGLLDDALQLLPQRGVLVHHSAHRVLEALKGAGDGAHVVGRSGHGADLTLFRWFA